MLCPLSKGSTTEDLSPATMACADTLIDADSLAETQLDSQPVTEPEVVLIDDTQPVIEPGQNVQPVIQPCLDVQPVIAPGILPVIEAEPCSLSIVAGDIGPEAVIEHSPSIIQHGHKRIQAADIRDSRPIRERSRSRCQSYYRIVYNHRRGSWTQCYAGRVRDTRVHT